MIEANKRYINNANSKDTVKVVCVEVEDGEKVVMFTRYGCDSMFALPLEDFTNRFTIKLEYGN